MRDFLSIRAFYYKLKNNMPKRTIQEFFEMLSYTLDTGIPLHNALMMLDSKGTDRKIQQLVKPLAEQVIHEGAQLSEALDKSNRFKPAIVQQIRSGEESNTVPAALERVSASLSREIEFQGRVNTNPQLKY